MSTFAISVDSSIYMTKDEYYIRYKDVHLKYMRHKKRTVYGESLMGFYNSDKEKEHLYAMMSEFLRAFAYINNGQIRFKRGIECSHSSSAKDIKKFSNAFYDKKHIPINNTMDNFYRISKVDNNTQAELLRLYTEANSNHNVYFRILFFWHTIAYPQKDEKNAIEYINHYIKENDIPEHRKRILETNKAFGDVDMNNLGNHIYKNIRHAIAHIVRNSSSAVNIKVDCMEQEVHLELIDDILKIVARHKLDNEHKLNENAGADICAYFNPDDLSEPYYPK